MSDDFEGRVRDWLRERGRTSDHELRALAGNVAVLPPRRPRRFRPLLAVAVVAVAVVGAWTLVPRFGQVSGQPPVTAVPPVPPDPAAFAGDPRLSRCGVPPAHAHRAFEMAHARDYRSHLPAMLLAPELDVDDPAFVVVFDGPQPFALSGGAGPSTSNQPGNHDVCILVGHDPATATLNLYGDVDVTGFTAVAAHSADPSHGPTPTPAHASHRPAEDPTSFPEIDPVVAADPRLRACVSDPHDALYAFVIPRGRDVGRYLPGLRGPEFATMETELFVVVKRQPGFSRVTPGRTQAPASRDVCTVPGIGGAPAHYLDVSVEGFVGPPAQASPSPTPTAQASTSWPPGCGPSNLDITESPASPGWGRAESPLLARDTVVPTFEDLPTHAFHPLRPDEPEGRPLQHILLIGTSNISLLYAREPLDDADTLIDAYRKGLFGLEQRPFAGQDADFVLENAPRDSWRVQVGPHPAALVLGTPITTTIRTYKLYWADGEREWILHGDPVDPEELVDLARSIYC